MKYLLLLLLTVTSFGEAIPARSIDRHLPEVGTARGQLLFAMNFNSGTKKDLTNGGHDGTYSVDTDADIISGRYESSINGLIRFDGDGGNYDLSVPASCGLTIIAWYEISQDTENTSPFSANNSGNSHKQFTAWGTQDRIGCTINTTTGSSILYDPVTWSVGDTQMAAIRYEYGGRVDLWRDGVEVASAQRGGHVDNYPIVEDILIGGVNNGAATKNGAMIIDEVRFYLYDLTDIEIKQLHQQGPSK